jgi:hypothetical protein
LVIIFTDGDDPTQDVEINARADECDGVEDNDCATGAFPGVLFATTLAGDVRGANQAEQREGSANQGLTLVHFSAQRKRFVWDRGCI